jgi:DeoR/GlpR family transcriptional regulator of sugar metabolism
MKLNDAQPRVNNGKLPVQVAMVSEQSDPKELLVQQSPPWLVENNKVNVDQKRGMAKYTATTVVKNLSSMLVDHGTTFIEVFTACGHTYSRLDKPLTLEVLTPSLALYERIRDLQLHKPNLFSGLRTTLTGGNVHPELHCLYGDFAVRGVNDDSFQPTTVFLGAWGLSAGNRGELHLAYAFPHEKSLKDAIARKATGGTKYIICDSSKFGNLAGWRVTLPITALLAESSGLVIITNTRELATSRKVFESELAKFATLFQYADRKCPGKTCEIRLVDKEGVCVEVVDHKGTRAVNTCLSTDQSSPLSR